MNKLDNLEEMDNMGFQDQVSPGLGSPGIAPDTACSQWGGFVRGR